MANLKCRTKTIARICARKQENLMVKFIFPMRQSSPSVKYIHPDDIAKVINDFKKSGKTEAEFSKMQEKNKPPLWFRYPIKLFTI